MASRSHIVHSTSERGSIKGEVESTAASPPDHSRCTHPAGDDVGLQLDGSCRQPPPTCRDHEEPLRPTGLPDCNDEKRWLRQTSSGKSPGRSAWSLGNDLVEGQCSNSTDWRI